MNKLPKRKPIRIENYDYSTPGAYFITVCIADRKPILWNVGAAICRPNTVSQNVGAATCRPNLSKIGSVVKKAILQIPEHYPTISVDKYCVMPDHIHMILSINTDEDGRQVAAPTLGADCGRQVAAPTLQNRTYPKNQTINHTCGGAEDHTLGLCQLRTH